MPQFSAWRLFGELVTQLLSSKKNTKETEELNILLDAIILNRPAILVNHGFVVKPVMAFAPKEEGVSMIGRCRMHFLRLATASSIFEKDVAYVLLFHYMSPLTCVPHRKSPFVV